MEKHYSGVIGLNKLMKLTDNDYVKMLTVYFRQIKCNWFSYVIIITFT